MSSPAEYRKKPVVITAMQWDGTAEGAQPILVWIKSNDGHAAYSTSGRIDLGTGQVLRDDGPPVLTISTLEGHITASAGDYVIRGVKGEFYPCRADIFAETYDAA